MCAESSHVSSGFGNYTRNILTHLYNTGKYEIAELSCYRTAQTPKTEPWKIYPNVPSDPEAQKNFGNHNSSAFGSWSFEAVLIDFKPDIVFDVRDYWMLSFPEISTLRPYFYWIIAPTIDSAPQKQEWLQTFRNADMVLAHTDWGIEYLKSTKVPMNIGPAVNDSVDTNSFKPLGIDKKIHKSNNFIDPNDFIIGSVMRNQKRKLIPNLIKIVKELSKKYTDIKLYLHTSFPDNNGWNIPSLLNEFEANNLVYFTYLCSHCKKYFPSHFQNIPAFCPYCKNYSSAICSVSHGISDDDLSKVYNLFDLYIQYAICEGFGIPPVEAASCGVPIVTVDHGAMKEIGEKLDAKIVPVRSYFRELETNADRVLPDDDKCYEILEQEYLQYKQNSWLNSLKRSDHIRKLLLDNYGWEKTAKVFENIFDNVELTNLQGKWDSPMNPTYPDLKVPNLSSNRLVVNFIIDHLINASYLKHTAVIQELIANLNAGYVNNSGKIQKFEIKDAIKTLEVLLNNKTVWEAIRTGHQKLPAFFDSIISY